MAFVTNTPISPVLRDSFISYSTCIVCKQVALGLLQQDNSFFLHHQSLLPSFTFLFLFFCLSLFFSCIYARFHWPHDMSFVLVSAILSKIVLLYTGVMVWHRGWRRQKGDIMLKKSEVVQMYCESIPANHRPAARMPPAIVCRAVIVSEVR